MALEGTIRDFALPDIFQLIGIQRKTGVLTLNRDEDTVTIKFLEGHVVEADTASASLEDRLGTVLVRTSRITQAQLDEALEIQRQTLQRLGHILVKRDFISQDELVDALQIQSSQVIYRLFRWREGSYHFDARGDLDYDQSHSTPISAETILMEGARMVDEWPLIERRIGSDRMVFRKAAAVEGLSLAPEPDAPVSDADPLDEFDLGLDELDLDVEPGDLEAEARETADERCPGDSGSEIELSVEERQVIALVDGKRTVREIVDLLPLPEFETFRALSEMLARQLVEAVEAETLTGEATRRSGMTPRLVGLVAKAVLVLMTLGTLATLHAVPFSPWRILEAAPATERLRTYAAMARLEQIERAVQVFFLDSGSFPAALSDLVQYGYLAPTALRDPWGRPYGFQRSAGGYQIWGQDASGARTSELTLSRSFSEVQRLLLDDSDVNPPQ